MSPNPTTPGPTLSRRTVLRATGTLAATGSVAGCIGEIAPPGTGPSGDDPVRIGLSAPFTGFMSEEGPEMVLGVEFWRQRLHASGGLLDRPVEFVIYDDGSVEAGAKAAYERLLTEDDVDLVLGPAGTLATAGATPVLEQHGMPAVFPMAWGPYAQDINREWCTHFLPVATEAPRGLAAVLGELGMETFGLIKSSSGYVRDGAEGLTEFLDEEGIEVVAEATYERYNEAARREAVNEILGADADALGPGGSVAEVNPLIEEFAKRPIGDTAFAWFDFDDTRIFRQFEHSEGMLGLGMWAAVAPYPDNDEFVDEFSRFAARRRPDWSQIKILQHHPPASYSSALVLQRAVERAGSFDPMDVRDELWSLRTDTPFGTFEVDQEGYQVGKEMFVLQHQHGLREVVWPESIQTAEPEFPTLERTAPE